ncbi:helix-turn-helix transcriptional regulator [Paenibacillus polymyxa]|uniref:helix-turn-helix domain-containing protein n=1 Tax=Paenibacillus polymyxa TaxID=1406 RepID=UPI002ED367F1
MALRPGKSRLPQLLKENKMKRVDLAKYLGVSPSFMTRIIDGDRFFSYPLAARAAQKLGCTMEELHDWVEE